MMKPKLLALSLFVLLAFVGCSDASNETLPVDGDTPDGDAIDGDVDGDAIDGDTDGDAVDGDTDGDAELEDDGEPPAPTCEWPDELTPLYDDVDPAQTKFALSMFHFNVQYVAGGLDLQNGDERLLHCGSMCEGWDDQRLIDWIISDTFEPVLDMYLRHPDWRATFEMQGMMLEAIAERHPLLLEKMQMASQSGQIELVSFHYSAQLFLSFPKRDLARSVDLTKQLFEENCVVLSGTVFNQEGQAGEGKHAFMAETDPYRISVFPKNLYRYVRNEETRWPYYSDRGVDVVIGPGEADPESGITVTWPFFDDGEILVMDPLDPYFPYMQTEETTEKNLSEYEAELQALEDDGYKITSITDYVHQLKGRELAQPQLPPVLDGTWQPPSTDSVLRWMGGRSLLASSNMERDNKIRTENYRVSHSIAAARQLLDKAEAEGLNVDDLRADLVEGERELFKAEVTDATGITPWIGEYLYAVWADAAALQVAERVAAAAMERLGWSDYAGVDLATGISEAVESLPVEDAPIPMETPPMQVTLSAQSRETSLTWFEYGQNTYRLELSFGPSSDPTGKEPENALVTLTFPRNEDVIAYSPALLDDEVVSFTLDQFNYLKDEVYLTLANGLIGLGGDWWVIKNCRQVHVAVRIPSDPEDDIIQFVDETADPENGDRWEFLIFNGSEADALDLARRTNTHPRLICGEQPGSDYFCIPRLD